MLKYYLDKTGKVIKSILFPSSEFVDTEPREGSMNPVTSGAVAGSVAQQSSNIAPNYTKKTYEANSYVMQDGVLYTNPNAIGTAEDWNPAHWTQTTVAEMMAGAGDSGYTQVDITLGKNDPKVIPVGQKEDIYVECDPKFTDILDLQIAEDCTDAVIRLKRVSATKFQYVNAKRGNTYIPIYGKSIVTQLSIDRMTDDNQLMLSANWVGEHGEGYYDVPNDFSEVIMNSTQVVSNVTPKNVDNEFNSYAADSWVFVVKGRAVMCLPN
jgi:hypothetical protein